jgi:hypothetical protein
MVGFRFWNSGGEKKQWRPMCEFENAEFVTTPRLEERELCHAYQLFAIDCLQDRTPMANFFLLLT